MNSKRIDLIENSDINDHHYRTCLSCMYDIDTIMHIRNILRSGLSEKIFRTGWRFDDIHFLGCY